MIIMGCPSFFVSIHLLLILYLIVACLQNMDRVGEKCGIRWNGWCLSQKVTELYEM